MLDASPAQVALAGYRGLMAGKRAVLPGIVIKFVPFFLRLFPRSFIVSAVGRFQIKKG
jgi:short-subunit dehydrogenase